MSESTYTIKIRRANLGATATRSDFYTLFEASAYKVHAVVVRVYLQPELATVVHLNTVDRRDGAKMDRADWQAVNDMLHGWANATPHFDDVRIASSQFLIRQYGAVRMTYAHGYFGKADRWVNVHGVTIQLHQPNVQSNACVDCGNSIEQCDCHDED